MLVSRVLLDGVLDKLTPGVYAVDTETTGIRAYHGDRLFSLIIANGQVSWYFNFQCYEDLGADWVLPREETFLRLAPFFAHPSSVFYLQNAKFDLAMLAREGIEITGKIYDTEVMGRLLYNRHLKYDLGSLVKPLGIAKSTEVEEYIAKHRLYTWQQSPGKEKREKKPHYDRVPFPIISRYGERDGEITWQLGEHQRREITKLSDALTKSGQSRSLSSLLEMESDLTKTCFAMERAGVRVDRSYCQEAYSFEVAEAREAAGEFEALAGVPLLDSRLVLARAFTAAGERYPTTDKGNPSFTDEVLSGFTSPLAKCLQRFRAASKRANTYFANFLYYADAQDRIHPNMRQAGTDTGRMSFSAPNLQNVPKSDDGPYPVRRAFVPTSAEWRLVCIDYDQMEYRLLLDYANDESVIRKILDDGLDVHQATADKMGVDRQAAKTLNFLLLYGGGAQNLADAIGVPLSRARDLKHQYFEALPGVRRFSRGVMDMANVRGYIFNWAGRVCHFPLMPDSRTGREDRFAYRAPNHCIQGGCADIVKIAMNGCHRYLTASRFKSRLILQVHDELMFEVHETELGVIPALKQIMEKAYPFKRLPLTCSVEISDKSWADTVAFAP